MLTSKDLSGISLNNKNLSALSFNSKNYKSVFNFDITKIKKMITKGKNSFKIEGLGKKSAFVHLQIDYFTEDTSIKEETDFFTIKRKYYKLEQYIDDEKIKYRIGKKVSSLDKGENFIAEIEITSSKIYNYLMVEESYPAGCQPVKDFLLYNIENVEDKDPSDFIDWRDEKVIFFCDQFSAKKFYYVLSPIYKGDYNILPVTCSAMYFPNIRGNSSDNTLRIK